MSALPISVSYVRATLGCFVKGEGRNMLPTFISGCLGSRKPTQPLKRVPRTFKFPYVGYGDLNSGPSCLNLCAVLALTPAIFESSGRLLYFSIKSVS